MAVPTQVVTPVGASQTASTFNGNFVAGYSTAVADDVQWLLISFAATTTLTTLGAGWTVSYSGTIGNANVLFLTRVLSAGMAAAGTSSFSASTRVTIFRGVTRGADPAVLFDVALATADGAAVTALTCDAPSVTTVTPDVLLQTFMSMTTPSAGTTATMSVPSGMTGGVYNVGTAAVDHIGRTDFEARATPGATGTRTSTKNTPAATWRGLTIAWKPVGSSPTGAVALTATATLTATAVTGVSGAAAVAATATLTATGVVAAGPSVSLPVTATVSAAGVVGRVGTASRAVTATVTASGSTGRSGAVSLSVTAAVSASGAVAAPPAAAVVGVVVSVTADGAVSATAVAALSVTVGLSAAGVVHVPRDITLLASLSDRSKVGSLGDHRVWVVVVSDRPDLIELPAHPLLAAAVGPRRYAASLAEQERS